MRPPAWPAISKLGRLIVLFDDNGISIDGPTSMRVSDDHDPTLPGLWLACGERRRPRSWSAVAAAIRAAKADARPSLVRCKTTIGFGAPNKGWHRWLPRFTARRYGDRRRAGGSRLAACAIRDSGGRIWTPGGRAIRTMPLRHTAWAERLESLLTAEMEFLARIGWRDWRFHRRPHSTRSKKACARAAKARRPARPRRDVLEVLVERLPMDGRRLCRSYWLEHTPRPARWRR